MDKVNITINNINIDVDKNLTILQAARLVKIDIPHLCYHPDQSIKAKCRLCVVDVKGSRKLTAACSTYVWDGMVIDTNSARVWDMQKGILELILANHNQDCLKCVRNGNCELQNLCRRFGISRTHLDDAVDSLPLDDTNPSVVRDYSKCIKCGRCVEVCQKTQKANVLTHSHRSVYYSIAPVYDQPLEKTTCVFCGQCTAVCPVGAIYEKSDIQKVWETIHNPDKYVIAQIAPAVRVALGEPFGLPGGEIVTGKTVAALRRLGFDEIFDTNFTADLTIIEEATELVGRIKNGGVLPMITSCSPGWINYIEGRYEHLLPHLSTCKSPQQMFGALSKTYYADIKQKSPQDIVTVSIMPCTAKKYECRRPEMETDGVPDVDYVLTTRELAEMIRSAGIQFAELDEDSFDEPFGIGTGAGAIFGATGGVMEAALRTAYETLTGETLRNLNFNDVRGFAGIKESDVKIGDLELKVAVAHGLGNADTILKQIEAGQCPYHFIEIMACPGGCLGGGGQPIKSTWDIKEKRRESIYSIDSQRLIRKSHRNPDVNALYEKFLGEPNGEKAHKLLHTHYYGKNKLYDFSALRE